MSLRVSAVLALPGLESLRLRAGAAGLENPVRWTYVAENEGIDGWVMGGELVFVTGINHPRDEGNLLRLIGEAQARVAAGVVILTGQAFIHAIPESVIAEAERLGVPLLEQPYELKMVEVSQIIGTALVQEQMLGRSREHILQQMLEGDYQSLDVLLRRAESLQLPVTAPRQLALFKLHDSERLFTSETAQDGERRLQASRQFLQRRLEQLLDELGDPLPLVHQGEHWVALLPSASLQQPSHRQAVAGMLDELNPELWPLRLFAGLSAAGHGPAQLGRGLGEARQALVAAQSFPERLGLCCFSDLGVLELLGAIGDRSLLDRFVDKVLGALINDDSRHEPIMMPTLEAWFHENGNLGLAAQRLSVHRNTLSYRMQRIEALAGCSFNDPHDRLNLAVALMIWRLSSPTPARSNA